MLNGVNSWLDIEEEEMSELEVVAISTKGHTEERKKYKHNKYMNRSSVSCGQFQMAWYIWN